MSDANPEDQDASNSQSYSAEIDAVCDRFEAAWKAGAHPQIKDYLCQAPEPARANLFRHLLALELYYRRAAGETPELAKYQERFPDYLAAVADAFPTLDHRGAADRRPAKPTSRRHRRGPCTSAAPTAITLSRSSTAGPWPT